MKPHFRQHARHTAVMTLAGQDVPCRHVTTRDGIEHRVPSNITRNESGGCWVVIYRKGELGTRAFGAGGTVASLRLAIAELRRRLATPAKPGQPFGTHVRERPSKRFAIGVPGVIPVVISTGAYSYLAIQAACYWPARQRRYLRFSVGSFQTASQERLDEALRLAVAARAHMTASVERGDFAALRALRVSLPSSVRRDARSVDIPRLRLGEVFKALSL